MRSTAADEYIRGLEIRKNKIGVEVRELRTLSCARGLKGRSHCAGTYDVTRGRTTMYDGLFSRMRETPGRQTHFEVKK